MWQTCTKYSQWIRDIVVKNVGDSFSSLSSISVSFYPQPLIVIKHKVAQPETTSKLGTVPYKNSESSLSHPGTSKLRKSLLLLCVCVWHVHNFLCHNRNYGHDSWSSETSSPPWLCTWFVHNFQGNQKFAIQRWLVVTELHTGWHRQLIIMIFIYDYNHPKALCSVQPSVQGA